MFYSHSEIVNSNISNNETTLKYIDLTEDTTGMVYLDIARSVIPAAPIAPIASTPVQNDFGGLFPLK